MQYVLDAMLFDISPVSDPIHSGAAPYQFTYQFATTSQPSDLWDAYTGWTPLSTAEKTAYRAALDQIEAVLNVQFTEVTGAADPDINVGRASLGAVDGYGGYTYSYNASQQVTTYDAYTVFDSALDLSGDAHLMLHEIGHALGLKHPFDGITLPAAEENGKYSLMSYDPNPDTGFYADGLQLYDIFALQSRWGTNPTTGLGDTAYTGPRNATLDAIWDAGGTDHFDASARSNAVVLDLREGAFSRFGAFDDVAIAYGTVIEHATGGSAGDSLTGNIYRNQLTGLAGNDTLSAAAGRDTLYGGDGDDWMSGGRGLDYLKGDAGNDFMDGNKSADRLYGGFGDDTLRGGPDDDFLNGGRGRDRLVGNDGADTFQFTDRSARDRILDFEDNIDTIDLQSFGFATVSDALALATESGGRVIFSFSPGILLVVDNMTVSALSDDLLI